jgi:hypothetical protein
MGYEGVHKNGEAKSVATWRVPRMAPTDQQAFTITLSSAPTTMRGTIHWAKPAVKADDEVRFQLAAAGGRGGRGGGN